MLPAKASLNDKEERLLGNKNEKEDGSAQRYKWDKCARCAVPAHRALFMPRGDVPLSTIFTASALRVVFHEVVDSFVPECVWTPDQVLEV